jgi:hypothetical protein
LTNGNFSSAARTVAFALVFNGTAQKTQQNLTYTATLNKSGTAK